MFLERVEIENIRSLKSIDLSFLDLTNSEAIRNWTLLVGENGTGKSSVLKCIGLVLGGSEALRTIVGDTRTWVRRGTQAGHIRAHLRTAEWEHRVVELRIQADDNIRTLYANNRLGLELLDDALEHANQNYFVAAYGPFRRLSDESGSVGLKRSSVSVSPRAECMATLFDKEAAVHPLQLWAMDLDYQKGDEGLDIVRDSMNKLLPAVEFFGIEKSDRTLLFNTPDGVVPLEQLSDGYQNVAAWIGDLLFRVSEAFAHYRRPLEARGVLLIDEVDAHLHPAWQRRLREFLGNTLPNFQIIATTHSALTLQQAHEGEATVLSRDQKNLVRSTPFPTDPSKLRLHQIYDLGFRISSLDSWEIERTKADYRSLSSKAEETLSADEKRKLNDSIASLEMLPDQGPDGLGNESMQDFLSQLRHATDEITKAAKKGR